MKTLIAFLALVIAIATLLVAVSDSDRAKDFYEMIENYLHPKKTQSTSKPAITRETSISNRASSSEITPEKLLIAIKAITLDSRKVEHIQNYKDSVTDNIKLSMITRILKEFTLGSQALRALDLLKHKISKNYSSVDLKEFLNIFTLDSEKTTAMRILKEG